MSKAILRPSAVALLGVAAMLLGPAAGRASAAITATFGGGGV